eukprot:1141057-Pelagomonas_calceolata.AAC.1
MKTIRASLKGLPLWGCGQSGIKTNHLYQDILSSAGKKNEISGYRDSAKAACLPCLAGTEEPQYHVSCKWAVHSQHFEIHPNKSGMTHGCMPACTTTGTAGAGGMPVPAEVARPPGRVGQPGTHHGTVQLRHFGASQFCKLNAGFCVNLVRFGGKTSTHLYVPPAHTSMRTTLTKNRHPYQIIRYSDQAGKEYTHMHAHSSFKHPLANCASTCTQRKRNTRCSQARHAQMKHTGCQAPADDFDRHSVDKKRFSDKVNAWVHWRAKYKQAHGNPFVHLYP